MKNNLVENIKTRIDSIMRAQGLKRYTLAEKAGIAAPTIQNWYTKRKYHPTLYSLSKISDVLQVSVSELCLEENSNMYPINEDEKKLLENYQKLSPEGKKLLLDVSKNFRKDV